MGNLNENPNLFKRGGVIGRMGYLKNMVILFAVVAGIFLFVGNYISNTGTTGTGMSVLAMFCLLGVTYLSYINSFKRLRDLRGTTHQEIPFQVALAVLMTIPYVSLIPVAVLLFAEGAVTGNSTVFANLEAKYRGDYKRRDEQMENVVKLDDHRRRDDGDIRKSA